MRRAHWVILLGVTSLSTVALQAQGQDLAGRALRPKETSCFTCHMELDDRALEPTLHIAVDVHLGRGLGCHDCHGGNPSAGFEGDPFAAHDESKGFRGKPPRNEIPEFCARCHSDVEYMKRFNPQARVDQLSEYRTSVHGLKNGQGDPNVAVCVDCHGVHGMRAPKDPQSAVHPTNVADTCGRCHANPAIMGSYNIPVTQYQDYKNSVHAKALYDGRDLSAPTCNDCHGNHGAVPPGVETVTMVCGSCHARQIMLVHETEAKRGIDLTPSMHCIICHSNHAVMPPTDEMLGVGPKSVCTPCHPPGNGHHDEIEQMSISLGEVRGRLEEAQNILGDAERAGMEVGPDQFALQEAVAQLVELRVLVHSFDPERFDAAARVGMAAADAGVAAGERAFKEFFRRRVGLALALVVIIILIIALVLQVRALEQGPKSGNPEPS